MRRTIKYIHIAIFGLALIALAVGPAWAVTYKRLSQNHTLYGVSQFLAGGVAPIGNIRVKLVNPTPVTMVAAAFFYERGGGNRDGTPEQFHHCVVKELSPHAAIQIKNDPNCTVSNPNNTQCVPLYVEVISVPVEPVSLRSYWREHKRFSRIADGLGIVGSPNTIQGNLFLLNPKLFSLPSDIDGQREEAIKSVCTELEGKGLSTDLFEEFGIFCP